MSSIGYKEKEIEINKEIEKISRDIFLLEQRKTQLIIAKEQEDERGRREKE